MNQRGRIALIGSGELTPSMVELHKHLLSKVQHPPTALFLDTPAGFQPNSDDICQKAQEYFRQNVLHQLHIASFKSAENASSYDIQILLQKLERSSFLLVGPGSPTYMLRQLEGSVLLKGLIGIVREGGCLAIASAAALTSGVKTLPVYEIYKVGQELHWLDGLNIMGEFGLDIVVIPHWNNAEGGTHDTRFCYMGENRFLELKQLLPENTMYLGIDEHTSCIIDFENDIAEIKGQSKVTLIQGGQESIYGKGEVFSLDIIRQGLHKKRVQDAGMSVISQSPASGEEDATFWDNVHKVQNIFAKNLAKQDYISSTKAILDLDSHLNRAALTFESDENLSQAREIYRELIVLLSVELQQIQNEVEVHYKPLVENLLHLRNEYKNSQNWSEADALRNIMEKAGIGVMDTKDGSRWQLKSDNEV